LPKLKVALYWAASCGGCEIATLAIGDKILKLAEAADIVFWPIRASTPAFSTAPSATQKTSTWPNCYGRSPRS